MTNSLFENANMNCIFAIHRLGFLPLLAWIALSRLIPVLWSRQHSIASHIVCHVPQSDLSSDTDYAYTTHNRTAGTHRHDTKYMFNTATYSRPTPISLLFSGGQFLVPASFTLYMLAKSLFVQLMQRILGAVCRISPDIFTGIARIKQFGKYLAVMDAGISHVVTANKFVPDINADVVLVAKERCAVLLRPAGIGIFLTPLCFRPG